MTPLPPSDPSFDISTPSDNRVPLSGVLSAAALEAQELAGLGNRFQGLVAELMRASTGADQTDRIVQAQGLDGLVQRLNALSTFLEALGANLPADWTVDPRLAAKNLSLDQSVRRFGRRAGDRVPAPPVAGDVDLF
jgi:hypothetical protein